MSRFHLVLPLLLVFTGCYTRTEDKPTGIPGVNKIPRTRQQGLAEANRLETLYLGKTQPESVRMFIAIVRGQVDNDNGWFGPAQTRYDWAWLARQCNADPKGGIPREKFPGTDASFACLDRDQDGVLGPADVAVEPPSPFKMLVPSSAIPVRSLFASELGSLQEGPSLGDSAPDFELLTVDGKEKVKLSRLIGNKPVVLVFGSYTCDSFRSHYKQIEDLKRSYGTEAEFLMVYVRESHPTDGWRMSENDNVGVFVAQPRTDKERIGVAQQCAMALQPTITLLVDGVDDTVGNAYSGMPERLYVLDRQGKVAYKSGRGPFGFKPEELERTLIMALLEAKEVLPKNAGDLGSSSTIALP